MRFDWITIGTTPAVFFSMPPSWTSEVSLSLTIPDSYTPSQSNKTSARAFAASLRYTMAYTGYVDDADSLVDIQKGCTRLKDTPQVVIPLWTDIIVTSRDTPAGNHTIHYTGQPPARYGQWFVFLNTTTWLYEFIQVTAITATTITYSGTTANDWPTKSYLFPVMWGRFQKQPIMKMVTDCRAEIDIDFKEHGNIGQALSPWAQANPLQNISSAIGTSGTSRLYDVTANYTGSETNTTAVDIDWEMIGEGRLDADFAYPQGPRRLTELNVSYASRDVISRIESIFLDRRGRLHNLWVPTFRDDIPLNAPVPTPGSPAVVGAGDFGNRYYDANFESAGFGYLCLNDNAGNFDCFKAVGLNLGGLFITANRAITNTYQPNSAKLSELILCRFQENKIEWKYTTDNLATTTIKFLEMTEEYLYTPQEENVAYCFAFTELDIISPAGNKTWFYTSYESNISVSGLGTFTPGWFELKEIKTGSTMDSDQAQIDSFQFTGNPFSRLFPFIIEGDLQVQIYEVNLDTNTASLLFVGTAEDIETDGAKITVTLKTFAETFDQQFHRHMIAALCPYVVYSKPCGADINAHKAFFTVNLYSPGQLSINLTIAGFSPAQYAYNNGVLTVETAGKWQNRAIVFSNQPAGGILTLQLVSPLNGVVAGDTVSIAPGCDGSGPTCQNVFNNLPNFGGEPTMAAANPSITPISTSTSGQGGKK
jgi:uncharacterized phage protein (TIGR02218 family)